MRGCGSDLRIAPRRRQAKLRQLRLVVAVNQIMRYAGMIGLGSEKLFQNCRGLLAVGEGRIFVWLRREQGERVERSRLVIVGITFIHFLHRSGIGFGAGTMIQLPGVTVESADGSDVCLLTRGNAMLQLLRFLNFVETVSDNLFVGLIPQLMPDAHGYAPMGHGA